MGWRGAHREDEGGTMSDISRRNLLKGAAVSAVSISAMGLLGACAAPSEPKAETTTDPSADGTGTGSGTNSEYMAEVLEPTSMPDASTASNFNIIYDSKTTVGTTYENLMTAIAGETGATTKYEAFSKVAKNEGFDVLARLFQCTADAEKIHIGLEYDLAKEIDPATEKPEPPAVEEHESDINLISGANGEIYETSDMYPSFIKKAQEEGNNKAVQVFTRAKLAEACIWMRTPPSTPRSTASTTCAPSAATSTRAKTSPPAPSAWLRSRLSPPTRPLPHISLSEAPEGSSLGRFSHSRMRLERFPTFAPVRRPRTSRRPLRANLAPVWRRCVPVCRLRTSRLSVI